MASVAHCLVMVLSSLLIASSYGFPSLRPLFQDGWSGDSIKAHSPHGGSPLAVRGQWEWMTAGEASHEQPPPLPYQKRKAREVAATTERSPSLTIPTTTGLQEDDETTEPGLPGTDFSTEAPATPSASLGVGGTKAATVRTAALLSTGVNPGSRRGQTAPVTLIEDVTETTETQTNKPPPPPHTVGITGPSSTAPSKLALPSTSAISVVTSGLDSKPGVKTGSTSASSSPPTPRHTAEATPLPKGDHGRPDKMLKQCLLAISLLALVAGIFIIMTFVLAAMLWRQKRAYKLSQRNPTEMVCISSLLAAEEAETSEGRFPRTKRVKMLAENGSEVDMDNLTLNSFLPDH